MGKGLVAFEIGHRVKEEILDYAVRSSFKSNNTRRSWEQLLRSQQVWRQKRALGQVGYKYLKGVRIISKGVTGANAVFTGLQLNNDIKDGRYYTAGTRLVVAGLATGAVFIPVVGWGVSLGISVADAVWGDEFYEYVETTFRN